MTRLDPRKDYYVWLIKKLTSRSIISRGNGASGFSPVSTISMSALFNSLSKNPKYKKLQMSAILSL